MDHLPLDLFHFRHRFDDDLGAFDAFRHVAGHREARLGFRDLLFREPSLFNAAVHIGLEPLQDVLAYFGLEFIDRSRKTLDGRVQRDLAPHDAAANDTDLFDLHFVLLNSRPEA